jgi:hypothetical protein
MSVVVERFEQPRLNPHVRGLRAHAAVVRALLDELERTAPFSDCSASDGFAAAELSCFASHIAEELARLAGRMLECAAVAALLAAPQLRPRVDPSDAICESLGEPASEDLPIPRTSQA